MSALIEILFVLLISIPLLIWGYLQSHRRRKLLNEWAISQDFSFDPQKNRSLDETYPVYECLRRGRSRYGYNHMHGTWQALKFHAFDYHYVTGSGKSRKTHRFSAVMIESPQPLKDLLIRTERFGDRVAEFFGDDDIDFESIEFSKQYFVKSSDKKWAFDVLHQRTIEFIMGWPTFNVQFDRNHVIAWADRLFQPADFQNAADLIHGILDRLPGYLTKSKPDLKKPERGRLRL